jgi:N-acetyltransferase 10
MDCIRNAGFVSEGKADVKFVTAGRGRGKSAALGLSIASALAYQLSNVFITASGPESIQTVFEFIEKGLEALGYQKNQDF